MSKTYLVYVDRTVLEQTKFRIAADSEAEAKAKALEIVETERDIKWTWGQVIHYAPYCPLGEDWIR